LLNKAARELKATKIALGHNLDDEAQNVIMNMVQGNVKQSARLGPKTGLVKDRRFVPRIKPLYLCTEEDVRRYSEIHNFPVVYDPCPCSVGSFRSEIRDMLKDLESKYPGTMESMMRGFLETLPALRASQPESVIGACRICGEPASNELCKV